MVRSARGEPCAAIAELDQRIDVGREDRAHARIGLVPVAFLHGAHLHDLGQNRVRSGEEGLSPRALLVARPAAKVIELQSRGFCDLLMEARVEFVANAPRACWNSIRR
jgi:hypothetical protein